MLLVDVIEACYESHKYIVFCHYNSYTQLSSASEVTTLWRYTNLLIIIIIIINISRSTQPSTCRDYWLLS